MKAVQINKYGGSEVLKINDIPEPNVGKNQVLVEVYAASINPIDWKIRDGYMKEYGWLDQLKFPVTLGGDFSGLVKEIENNASDLKINDEVYGFANILYGGSGSFAQLATLNNNNLAKKPKNLGHNEAASLPLVGTSALQAIVDLMKLRSGQKILVHGGAGGIGSIAIQLAEHIGAYVATTVGAEDQEYVKGLGADEAIDYKNQKFEEILKDYDAVFDTVGGETTTNSFKVLRKSGILVSMLGEPDKKLTEEYGTVSIGLNAEISAQNLKRLTKLVEDGKIKPQVDKVFPLEQPKEAFDYQEKNSPRGKVVLKVKS